VRILFSVSYNTKVNHSPWIEELDANRIWDTLPNDNTTDIAIVGAGIAGFSTAFFTLTRTDKRIIMLERGLMAHGASGHNAGMLVPMFERPLHHLAEEFPAKLVAEAQIELETGWALLDEMIAVLDEPISYHRKVGYGGLRTLEETVAELENVKWEKDHNIPYLPIFVADTAPFLAGLKGYEGLFEIRSHEEILDLLETKHPEYVACTQEEFGVLNSALLCEKLLKHFLATYPDRFVLYEKSPVLRVALHEENAILDVGRFTVDADRVVLCTNGFEDISIVNKSGLDIDTRFHHFVSGKVGFMTAYVEHEERPASAGWYSMPPDALSLTPHEDGYKEIDAFIYTSRRPHPKGALVAIGGPDMQLEDRAQYDANMEYPLSAEQRISSAIQQVRDIALETKEGRYMWHGLMGYTPTGVRVVGVEPKNSVLLYNLGCNGIGLLPSLAGGKRISSMLRGEKLPRSLFDPR
jgi:glycine/D-amino acid oxidase-like deaminating enzyme